jgi:urease accessory protein
MNFGRKVEGHFIVDKVGNKSTSIECLVSYPLKILTPSLHGKDYDASYSSPLWWCAVTFGGGILSGDNIQLNIEIRKSATAVMITQATTKVFMKQK